MDAREYDSIVTPSRELVSEMRDYGNGVSNYLSSTGRLSGTW